MLTDIMFDLPTREDVREVVITKEAINEGMPAAHRHRAGADQAGGVRRYAARQPRRPGGKAVRRYSSGGECLSSRRSERD